MRRMGRHSCSGVTRGWKGVSSTHTCHPVSRSLLDGPLALLAEVYIHLDVLAARSLPSGDEVLNADAPTVRCGSWVQDGVPDACYEVKASGRIEYRNVRCNSFGHLNPCLSCAVDRKVGDQTALLHEKDPFCRLTAPDSILPFG